MASVVYPRFQTILEYSSEPSERSACVYQLE
jgi:hypothetical protein